MNSLPFSINNQWTLFLDRDGVINERLMDDYVKTLDEFVWLPGTLEAMRIFSRMFSCIIVVTNQQGIGKGLMSENDLERIHEHMRLKCEAHGGRMDAIYHCPMLAHEAENCRKPSIGMALWAKRDFPQINFAQSLMVGDSCSDIQFAKNAGMKSVQIRQESSKDCDADLTLDSLLDLAHILQA